MLFIRVKGQGQGLVANIFFVIKHNRKSVLLECWTKIIKHKRYKQKTWVIGHRENKPELQLISKVLLFL